jgi:hypothetical protein
MDRDMKIQTTHTAADVHPSAIPGRFVTASMPSSSEKIKNKSWEKRIYRSDGDIFKQKRET